MPTKTCISCNKILTADYVEFKCPMCSKVQLFRCASCRRQSKPYKCSCGFEGP